jgi:hypothetical protein
MDSPTFTSGLDKIREAVADSLSILDNKYIAAIVYVCLILYASLAAPNLPPYILGWFENSLFRLFIIFLIFYIGLKDGTTALLMALGFIITIQTLNKMSFRDQLMAFYYGLPFTKQAVPEQQTMDMAPEQQTQQQFIGPSTMAGYDSSDTMANASF